MTVRKLPSKRGLDTGPRQGGPPAGRPSSLMALSLPRVDGILGRIGVIKDSLYPAERRVADIVIERPQEVIHLPIADLAALAEVSEGTVVRFCQSVGCQGYQSLKLALAGDLAQPGLVPHSDLTERDAEDPASVVRKVFASDIRALQETLKLLDPQALSRAVQAIERASTIAFFAVGSSIVVASDAAGRFLRYGSSVKFSEDAHTQIALASLLEPSAVAIAISNSGASREPVECLALARSRRATTIAVTARDPSPLTRHADIVLLTTSNETRYREGAMASRIAQVSLLDSLSVSVALRRPDTSSKALAEATDALVGHRWPTGAVAARAPRDDTSPEASDGGRVARRSLAYKTVGVRRIQADFFRPAAVEHPPLIIWIHGGGLVAGSRGDLDSRRRDLYLDAGFAVLAIDYRLAPETKLAGILDDVGDAYHWAIAEASRNLRIDPERIALVGHSAGGYLALAAGGSVQPAPRAIVSFYGYGDIAGDWYCRPDPFYLRQRIETREDASRSIGSGPTSGNSDDDRIRFYVFCRQRGLWPREVAGLDLWRDPDSLTRFRPILGVSPTHPPTLLLHGDQDTDVPFSVALDMAQRLEEVGVEHRFVRVVGGGHGFDDDLSDTQVQSALDETISFLKGHLVADPAEIRR